MRPASTVPGFAPPRRRPRPPASTATSGAAGGRAGREGSTGPVSQRAAAAGEVSLERARGLVAASTRVLATETVSLESARGRVLAEPVVADRPLPGFDSSAMDGYAVRTLDVAAARSASPISLNVIGESRAGSPATAVVGAGSAVAVSTGAVVPAGADAVVRVERTRRAGGRVAVEEAVGAGADIRRAGEDVRAGDAVLERGSRLCAAGLGMLAALGRSEVACFRRPRVAVLVTGDELASGAGLRAEGAVADSNTHTVGALARDAGAEVVACGRVGDDRGATEAALAGGAAQADLLVVCGGVSVGRHDHVRPSLAALGAEQVFWGVALKPGHPTWFGTLDGTVVFGLPGNPVSAMVTFELLARVAVERLAGLAPRGELPTARLDAGYRKPSGRAHALRVRLDARADGWHAALTGPQGSHVLSSMLAADALAIVAGGRTEVAPGERVPVVPLTPFATGLP